MATSQAKKALRQHRRDNGLCIHCGAAAKENQTRCQRCVDKDSENRKRRAARSAKQGVCSNDGCRNVTEGKTKYCYECNQKSGFRTYRRRKSRVADGLCAQCGSRPRWGRRIRCKACTERLNASVKRLSDKRTAAGKCSRCGDNVLVPGYKRCQPCIDEGRKRHADRKLDVLQAYGGPICRGCGETEVAVLQIDHIDGGGHSHALKLGKGNASLGRGKLYKWLQDNGYPSGFRVLCANCNIRAARGVPLPLETNR